MTNGLRGAPVIVMRILVGLAVWTRTVFPGAIAFQVMHLLAAVVLV